MHDAPLDFGFLARLTRELVTDEALAESLATRLEEADRAPTFDEKLSAVRAYLSQLLKAWHVAVTHRHAALLIEATVQALLLESR